MDFSEQTIAMLLIGILAFVCIAGIGLAFTYETSEDKAKRRVKNLHNYYKTLNGGGNEVSQRRKQTQKMLEKMREANAQKRDSLISGDTEARLQKAGLQVTTATFNTYALISAALFVFLTYYSGIEGPPAIGGIEFQSRPLMVLVAALIGGLGVPRFVLNFLTNYRSRMMINQFAEAIDIIVRGVKSGLPLNECLQIIARESPAPLGLEFELLSNNLKMGTTLERALSQFYKRVPLSEVNFFVIVLTIQAKAGGNLSEALGNLSGVIRSRKLMREKVKALSAEAKASAMIIGCLPFIVAFMVYLTTPSYIMELFVSATGHMILFIASLLMATGILVMRKMINFNM